MPEREELAEEHGFGVGEKGGSGAFSFRGTSFAVVGAQIGLTGNEAPVRERGARLETLTIVGRRRRSLSRGGGERGEPGAGSSVTEVDVKAETRRVGDESKEWEPLERFTWVRIVERYFARRRRRRRKRSVVRNATKTREERTPIAAFTPGERPEEADEVVSWASWEGASW